LELQTKNDWNKFQNDAHLHSKRELGRNKNPSIIFIIFIGSMIVSIFVSTWSIILLLVFTELQPQCWSLKPPTWRTKNTCKDKWYKTSVKRQLLCVLKFYHTIIVRYIEQRIGCRYSFLINKVLINVTNIVILIVLNRRTSSSIPL
jgi:hypothetical protein